MNTQKDALQLLKERLATISDIDAAMAVLTWDQQTYMPAGGIAGRSEQLATLSQISHEMLVSDETGKLLESAGEPASGSEDAAIIRLARRDYERATRLPARLVSEISRTRSVAQGAWEKARADSDWGSFASHLEKMVSLQREAAEHLGYEDHPYDALLDAYEPGEKKAHLDHMFAGLKETLVPMIKSLPTDEDREAPLHGNFGERKQEEFSTAVISAFGYDWERGRQDRVAHPFCISFGSPGDVRITTRFDPEWFSYHFFATLHEAGHALYEQGVNPAYSRTPLSGGVSMGVHESQSRLWENLVGRSRPFWTFYYPKLQATFPEAFGEVDFESFYRATNAAYPSEIRTEADELTYNMHILLRYELETSLLEGKLSVAELPEVWNAKMQQYLSITPKNEARGVLQDVHWAAGLFGYFPTYTLGNVLSAQVFDAAVGAHPEIPEDIERGKFDTLRGWLQENLYRHGSLYEPQDLIERTTGKPLDTAPYLNYLKAKFGELYDLA